MMVLSRIFSYVYIYIYIFIYISILLWYFTPTNGRSGDTTKRNWSQLAFFFFLVPVRSYLLFIKSCCESLSCICTKFAIHYLIEQERLCLVFVQGIKGCVCVHVRLCVCVCVCACVRACVRACMRACVAFEKVAAGKKHIVYMLSCSTHI